MLTSMSSHRMSNELFIMLLHAEKGESMTDNQSATDTATGGDDTRTAAQARHQDQDLTGWDNNWHLPAPAELQVESLESRLSGLTAKYDNLARGLAHLRLEQGRAREVVE
jgi:hypothetical protein